MADTRGKGPEAERDGVETAHNPGRLRQGSGAQGYDDAVKGRESVEHEDPAGDVDPDSAESDVDRDDTVDE